MYVHVNESLTKVCKTRYVYEDKILIGPLIESMRPPHVVKNENTLLVTYTPQTRSYSMSSPFIFAFHCPIAKSLVISAANLVITHFSSFI